MNKKIVFVVSLLIISFLIGNVLAITVSIGNAKMVVYANTGETVEKSILVQNTNDVALNIELFASGDLEDDITIKDTNFTLQPGEEKKAYFTIDVKKAGETESKINVQFTPLDGKNGAGLSSTIIVIAGEGNADDDTNTDNGNDNSNNSSSTGITGNVIGKINKNWIALGTTIILAIIFIVVLIIYYTKFKKKTKENTEKTKEEKIVKIYNPN